MRYSNEWPEFENSRFDFSTTERVDIRISFRGDTGSCSDHGTDCLATEVFPPGRPTMNPGWLKGETDGTERCRVVFHEVGHGLGAIHEHQDPGGEANAIFPKPMRSPAVLPTSGRKEEIDYNIARKDAEDHLNSSPFDSSAIMIHVFPPELIVGGVGVRPNTVLSRMANEFIGRIYPHVRGQWVMTR